MTLRQEGMEDIEQAESETGTGTESSSDEEDDSPQEILQNVGGFMSKVEDKIGMTLILEQVFRSSSVDLGALADFLIAQNFMGCVSKPTDDEFEDLESEDTFGPVCGVTSLINMKQHQDVACVKQIEEWLKLKAEESGSETDQAILHGLFASNSHQTPGFVIKERVLNLPAVLMMVELVSLKKDMTKALAEGKPFQTTHIIQIIKMFKTPAGVMMYSHEEEQVAINHAVCWFDYPIPVNVHGPVMYTVPETGVKIDCNPYRRVVIIPTHTFFTSFYLDFESKVKEINPNNYYEDPSLH